MANYLPHRFGHGQPDSANRTQPLIFCLKCAISHICAIAQSAARTSGLNPFNGMARMVLDRTENRGKPVQQPDGTGDKTAVQQPDGTGDKTAVQQPDGTGDKTAVQQPDGTGKSISTIAVASKSVSQVSTTTSDQDSLTNDQNLITNRIDLDQYRKAINSFISSYSSNAHTTLSPEQQNDLYERLYGQYVELYQILGKDDNMKYSGMATIGLAALRSGRVLMANTIYDSISYNTSPSAALAAIMRGVLRFIKYFSMLLIFIICCIYLFPILMRFTYPANSIADIDVYSTSINTFLHGDGGKVIIAAFSGCFGGIVSILLRLSEFEIMQRRSKEFMELTGTTLPLVGGISAAVVGAIFSANIININAGTAIGEHGINSWLYLVIGFLAGFSERFTRSILSVAENQFGGGTAESTQPPTTVVKTAVESDSVTLGLAKIQKDIATSDLETKPSSKSS